MTDLEKKILASIEQRSLTPRPYYMFLAKSWVFLSLAVVSIILGAVSLAVLLFAISDYYASSWRVLDNLPLDQVVLSIPVLWLVSMPLFIFSAYFGVRNTRRGYRFQTGHIFLLVLGASLALGVTLHLINAGQRVNDYLITHFAWYREQADVPFALWSRPEQGFLGGTANLFLADRKLRLIDFNLNVWTVDISGATIDLDQPILTEGDVAIRGHITGPMQFHADLISSFD